MSLQRILNFFRRIVHSKDKVVVAKTTTTPTTNNQTHRRERMPKEIRDATWIKYNGPNNTGQCYCCGVTIQRYNNGWHCSHVKADVKGGETTVDNLRACCRRCNLSMGDQNMYTYMRDKNKKGPGSKNIKLYLHNHPSQQFDKRTNNWGKKSTN